MNNKIIKSKDFFSSFEFRENFFITDKEINQVEAIYISSFLKRMRLKNSFTKIICRKNVKEQWFIKIKPTSLFYLSLGFPCVAFLQVPFQYYKGIMNVLEFSISLFAILFFCSIYIIIFLFQKKTVLKLIHYSED